MNKERRALLRKAADMVYEAKVMVARANDDEENAYDNLPDGIRDSDRGDTMQETIDQLDSIIEEGSGTVTTLDKNHGLYTHLLANNVYGDEIFG